MSTIKLYVNIINLPTIEKIKLFKFLYELNNAKTIEYENIDRIRW